MRRTRFLLITLIMTAILMLGMETVAAAGMKIYVKNRDFKGSSTLINRECYVTLGDLSEQLGCYLHNQGELYCLSLARSAHTTCPLGQNPAPAPALYINGTQLADALVIRDGIPYVALKRTVEALGGRIIVNEKTGITDVYGPARVPPPAASPTTTARTTTTSLGRPALTLIYFFSDG